MKKFYFFLVALLVGVMSASADYYLSGGFNGWKSADPSCLFTDNGDGTYVLDYNGQLTSGFKVNDGTWTNDKIIFGSNGSALSLGVPYNYSVGGSTKDISLAEGAVDNPHIVLDPTKKTLTITGQTPEDIEISYCLHGNIADASSWSDIALENTSGNIWAAEGVSVTATSNFGIKELTNGAQSAWIAADGTSAITASGVFNCTVNGTNFSIAAGTWNLTFDADAMTLTVASVGDTPVDPDPSAHNVYLAGEFNSWAGNDAAYKFTKGADGNYTLTVASLSGNFKVVSDGEWLGTTTPVVSGTSYVLEDIGYGNMTLAVSEATNVTLSFNPESKTLVATYGGGDTPITNEVYLTGVFNNWVGNDATYKFTEGENGVFTYSYSGTFTGEFKVVSNGEWLGNAPSIVSGNSYVLSDVYGVNATLASSAAENVVFTFTPATKTLVVTYTEGLFVPDALYVLGDLKDNHWDPSNGVALEKDGNVFTGTINLDTAFENDYGFFSLCTALGADSEDWSVGTRFGADEDGIVAESGRHYDFVQALEPNAWSALPAIYEISVDFQAKTMVLTWKSSGVDAIVEDADVAPVYYNLQGVRVAEPTNGLYIVVRGDKVAKQLVK